MPNASDAPKRAPRTDDLPSFERTFPGVQAELKELRTKIEADPGNTEPLLERARYFLGSRLPSARFNCADDCSRALELDPCCASAYRLRAEAVGQAPQLDGKLPARIALDWACALAIEPDDTGARKELLTLCALIWQSKNAFERHEELAALGETLAARVGWERAKRVVDEHEISA